VSIFVKKIDQEMRPWDGESAHRRTHTHWQTDRRKPIL